MNVQRLKVVVVCMFLMAWSFACTNSKKDSEPSAANAAALSDAEKAKLEELRSETEVGRNMAGRLLSFYGRYEAPGATDYLNQVAALVGTNSDFVDRKYMVDILDSDDINAFACPGGYILLTAGAVRHAKNEAEIAMVLGHEIAHVGKKHMYNRLKSMSAEELQKTSDELKSKSASDPDLKARVRPKPEQSEAGALIAKYLSGNSAGLNILAASRAGMTLILEKGLGSELESEADQTGVKYAIRTGYDPRALIDYLCRMENPEHTSGSKCMLPRKNNGRDLVLEKTHPPIKERVQGIGKLLASMNGSEMVGAAGEARFKDNAKLPASKNKVEKKKI